MIVNVYIFCRKLAKAFSPKKKEEDDQMYVLI